MLAVNSTQRLHRGALLQIANPPCLLDYQRLAQVLRQGKVSKLNHMEEPMKSSKKIVPIVLSTLLVSPMALAQGSDADRGFQGAAKDAWITGKIETVYTLNSELNPFKINTDVENGAVVLTGEVESDLDKDLATELARGIDGVESVRNDLLINPDYDGEVAAANSDENLNPDSRSDMAQWFTDTTTTAVVKSKLLANENTGGLQIDVDTANNVVMLSGTVSSDAEKELAGEIAQNSNNVDEVQNNLRVNPNS